MRSIKKILAFILIIVLTLPISVFADLPTQYSPYPSVPIEYKYKIVMHSYNNASIVYISSMYPYQAKLNTNITPNIYDIHYATNTASTIKVYDYRNNVWNSSSGMGWSANSRNNIIYTNYDLMLVGDNSIFHASDELPALSDCNIYKVGVGDTLNIQNSSTTDKFFYFKATNATYEKIVSIGSSYPTVNNYTNLTSGEWEWMEPEANSNYNYWKIRQGTIEIAVPKTSPLVVKITRKVPTGGYDTIPSPDRGNYENGIFGSISYGIDTLIYWVSYPFIAVGQLFVGLIDEIKLNLGWINDFTGLVGILFGWIPERFQGLLFIGASATVISFVIRVFRGS